MKKLAGILLAFAITAGAVFAQDAQLRTLTAGQKYKLKGAIVARDDDQSFILRDTTGVDTRVVISPESSIKTKGGWFGGGDRIASTQLVRGLYLEAEGRGDGSGALTASKIRFDKDDFKVAQSIDTRVGPAETRLTAAEQNAQRLSGQIDELMAISNAARGGARAAQETADAAVAGVNATNERITALDDYVVQSTETVNFRVGSAVLSAEGKEKLDAVANQAMTLKGYQIEITGFASSEGGTAMNKRLSENRA
ncbi:MAG TPA: OmpA family protein, partial [Pyrinomonadaceae bacterium]|nr:OmpA family protein [Pyrinomonadaceae bacterium]